MQSYPIYKWCHRYHTIDALKKQLNTDTKDTKN
ncbi:hypothetical protein L8106_02937 [Lyngbya sp. PCC 8106]|nr:hypothetical protein L8106_02937 [Lyngbya sp. PCC 8106]